MVRSNRDSRFGVSALDGVPRVGNHGHGCSSGCAFLLMHAGSLSLPKGSRPHLGHAQMVFSFHVPDVDQANLLGSRFHGTRRR